MTEAQHCYGLRSLGDWGDPYFGKSGLLNGENCLDATMGLNYFSMVFCYQNCSDLLWEKNCSSDREKLLNFEAEGREFAKFLRSLEQFVQTVKGQNNFW